MPAHDEEYIERGASLLYVQLLQLILVFIVIPEFLVAISIYLDLCIVCMLTKYNSVSSFLIKSCPPCYTYLDSLWRVNVERNVAHMMV